MDKAADARRWEEKLEDGASRRTLQLWGSLEVWKFGSLEVWMEKRGKAAAEKEEVGKVGSVEVGSVGEAFF